jgi:CRISPR-associated protein Cas4
VEAGGGEHEREAERVRRRKEIYGLLREEIAEILSDIPLESDRLVGRADTVLRLRNRELVPVEVKESDLGFVSRAWRKQLVAYSILLESKFGTKVRRGIIYTLPARRVLEVRLTEEEKRELLKDLDRMEEVARGDRLPPPSSPEKCGYCEVARFCRRL